MCLGWFRVLCLGWRFGSVLLGFCFGWVGGCVSVCLGFVFRVFVSSGVWGLCLGFVLRVRVRVYGLGFV